MPEDSIRISTLDPRDPAQAAAWCRYVDAHADATPFHSLAWKRAVERTFGHLSHYLIARRGEVLSGVLPLFEVRSVLAGRMLISVPYATYGGILADDSATAEALFDRAAGMARQSGAVTLELRSIRASVPNADIVKSHVFFRKPLPERPEDVAGTMPRKARAAARRAAERGRLTVTFDQNEWYTVWRLYARSMRRLGSPNYPMRFFEELVAAFGDQVTIQLVRQADRPVAGLLTLLYKGVVYPYFAGIDERIDIYGLNNYLYAESMRHGVECGYREYDFGRTRADNIGGMDFKRFCGFEPRDLEYQRYVPPGRVAPDLSAGSPRWAAARRVWKSLPLPLTRPLGAWLAKSIPG